jgi:hypothetical protein
VLSANRGVEEVRASFCIPFCQEWAPSLAGPIRSLAQLSGALRTGWIKVNTWRLGWTLSALFREIPRRIIFIGGLQFIAPEPDELSTKQREEEGIAEVSAPQSWGLAGEPEEPLHAGPLIQCRA